MTFSVIGWHQMVTRFGLDPACIGDPAYETRLLLEQMVKTPGLY